MTRDLLLLASTILLGYGCQGARTGPDEPAGVASLSIEPNAAQIEIGDTLRLAAIPRDEFGNPLPDRVVTWSSSAGIVAAVDDGGKVRGLAAGTAIITATSDGQTAQATVVVVFPPIAEVEVVLPSRPILFRSTAQILVRPESAGGIPLVGCTVTASSANHTIATLAPGATPYDFTITALGLGRVAIIVTALCGANNVRHVTVELAIEPLRFTAIDVGGPGGSAFACGIVQSGAVYCWGSPSNPLGDPLRRFSPEVPGPIATEVPFIQVSAGTDMVCGVAADGTAYCWGTVDVSGIFSGNGLPSPVGGSFTFRSVTTAPGGPVRDFLGVYFRSWACGVDAVGTALCWGQGSTVGSHDAPYDGWLGDGTGNDHPIPTPVASGHSYQAVAVSGSHTCGLTTEGAAFCWGLNNVGELGIGMESLKSRVPVAVVGGHHFTRLAAGWDPLLFHVGHSCGITTAGEAMCWGYNDRGRLGTGKPEGASSPTPVTGGLRFAEIDAAAATTCGIAMGGAAYCWGSNQYGQLGTGGAERFSITPVRVSGDLLFSRISIGDGAGCGIATDGLAYCWGASLPNAGPVPTIVPGQR